MALVQGSGNAQLPHVSRHNSRSGIRAPADDRIRVRTTNLGQLRRHVGILGRKNLVSHDGETLFRGQDLQLFSPGRAIGVGHGKQCNPLLPFRGRIGVNLLGGNLVVCRSFEDPGLNRIGNLHARCTGDKGNPLPLRKRDHSHGFAGGTGADYGNNLVIFDEFGCQLNRFGGITLGVIDKKFYLCPIDATTGIYLLDKHFQGVSFRFTQKRSRSGNEKSPPILMVGAA